MTTEQEKAETLAYHKAMLRACKKQLERFTVYVNPTANAKSYIRNIEAQIRNHKIGIKSHA